MRIVFMIVFIVIVGFGSGIVSGAEDQSRTTQESIPKNVDLQDEIARVVSVLIVHEKKQATEGDASDAVDRLIVVGGNRVDEVLLQTLLYRRDVLSDSTNERATRVLIGLLTPLVPEDQLVQTVTPCFERTTDKEMKKQLRMLLDTVTFKDSTEVCFDAFIPFLKDNNEAHQPSLIKYMIRLEPDAAILALSQSYSDSTTTAELKKSVERTSANVLGAILRKGIWWQDLYVAEKMRQNPELCDPELIEQLKESEHAVVREVAQEIEQKNCHCDL